MISIGRFSVEILVLLVIIKMVINSHWYTKEDCSNCGVYDHGYINGYYKPFTNFSNSYFRYDQIHYPTHFGQDNMIIWIIEEVIVEGKSERLEMLYQMKDMQNRNNKVLIHGIM